MRSTLNWKVESVRAPLRAVAVASISWMPSLVRLSDQTLVWAFASSERQVTPAVVTPVAEHSRGEPFRDTPAPWSDVAAGTDAVSWTGTQVAAPPAHVWPAIWPVSQPSLPATAELRISAMTGGTGSPAGGGAGSRAGRSFEVSRPAMAW